MVSKLVVRACSNGWKMEHSKHWLLLSCCFTYVAWKPVKIQCKRKSILYTKQNVLIFISTYLLRISKTSSRGSLVFRRNDKIMKKLRGSVFTSPDVFSVKVSFQNGISVAYDKWSPLNWVQVESIDVDDMPVERLNSINLYSQTGARPVLSNFCARKNEKWRWVQSLLPNAKYP